MPVALTMLMKSLWIFNPVIIHQRINQEYCQPRNELIANIALQKDLVNVMNEPTEDQI